MPLFQGQGAIPVVGPYTRRNNRGPALVQPGGVVSAVSTLIHDTFTATDGTNVNTRVPSPTNTPGTAWATIKSTWLIASNKVGQSAGGSGNILVDPGVQDYTVEFDVTTPGTLTNGDWWGVTVRSDGANAARGTSVAYFVTETEYGVGTSGGENFTGYEATDHAPLLAATTYHWKLVCLAGVVTLYVDDILILTKSGTSTLANKCGPASSYAGSAVAYDNFKVTVP